MLRERALLTMKLIDALDAQVTTHAFLRSLFWPATAFWDSCSRSSVCMSGQVAEHDSLCFINATLVLFMVAKHADGSVDKFLAELVRSTPFSTVGM